MDCAGRRAGKNLKPIGLFGGTFDPIHIGHLRLAEELRDTLNLEKIIFIPSGDPYQKSDRVVTAANHRVAMTRLAIASNSALKCDDRETMRSGATYTIDTLIEYRNELGNAQPIVWLLGHETLERLSTWHRWSELFSLAHFCAVWRAGEHTFGHNFAPGMEAEYQQRSTHRVSDLSTSAAGKILVIATQPPQISSTEIRSKCATEKSVRYLVPDSVNDYIEKNKLYR